MREHLDGDKKAKPSASKKYSNQVVTFFRIIVNWES